MKQPDKSQLQAIANVAVHNPRFREWLREWYALELDRLPSVTQNVAAAQGRCQVLAEIGRIIDQSPDMAANS